jgi:hypothetical protein
MPDLIITRCPRRGGATQPRGSKREGIGITARVVHNGYRLDHP